jgi:mannose-6-phosphate isomerase-like protein (cupin superfamily)
MTPVSAIAPLHHYTWGDACDGWVLVDDPALSVKKERMPAGTAEDLHVHAKAQQFFFILKGEAVFEVEGETFLVKEQEGLHIRAGQQHRIRNLAATDLEFILSSQPDTAGDRINITV